MISAEHDDVCTYAPLWGMDLASLVSGNNRGNGAKRNQRQRRGREGETTNLTALWRFLPRDRRTAARDHFAGISSIRTTTDSSSGNSNGSTEKLDGRV
jgi:hypothetical protein